jgi:regulator of sirC expression with transglutaminase-like and TPR domain
LRDIEAYLFECPHAADSPGLRARLPELRDASRKLN